MVDSFFSEEEIEYGGGKRSPGDIFTSEKNFKKESSKKSPQIGAKPKRQVGLAV